VTAPAAQVRLGEAPGRWVLLATVLGSGMAFLDATVVNVALPTIGDDLGADLGGLQWTLNGYTLTLASFILLGGSLGDRLGRRRVFVIGTIWFALASALCGIASNIDRHCQWPSCGNQNAGWLMEFASFQFQSASFQRSRRA